MNWTYSESDPAMMLFTASVKRFGLDWPEGATIAELGCAETDWLERISAQNPGLIVAGVDVHPQPRASVRAGNAMDPDLFDPESLVHFEPSDCCRVARRRAHLRLMRVLQDQQAARRDHADQRVGIDG